MMTGCKVSKFQGIVEGSLSFPQLFIMIFEFILFFVRIEQLKA